MTAHKNADLIKAKADNMDLVVLMGGRTGWVDVGLGVLSENYTCNFFLCLPKNKDVCLHFLNGGGAEVKVDNKWLPLLRDEQISLRLSSVFMQEHLELRMTPRLDNGWVSIKKSNNEVQDQIHDSKEDAINMYAQRWYYHVEIN